MKKPNFLSSSSLAKNIYFGLTIFLMSFRQEGNRDVVIRIKPVFKQENLILNTKKYTTVYNDTLNITKLIFYISNIKLTFSNGTEFNEKNSYHLINAEDIASLNINLKNIPEGLITSVNFKIGVDSLASVSGALEGDLDPVKGMYWAWNSGYIYAKLEGKTSNKEFEFHIGGYLSPNNAIRGVSVKLNNEKTKTEGNITINLTTDIECWFKNLSLQKTNRIVMPSKDAMKMADNYAKMFSVVE